MQFANGKEQRQLRLSSTNKSEGRASKSSSSGTGPSTCGPRSRNFRKFQGVALYEDAIKTAKPASPVKPEPEPEPDHALANSHINDWSPLDDNIVLVVPHALSNNSPPSREDVDAYISGILYGSSTKIRLLAFAELCSEKQSLSD